MMLVIKPSQMDHLADERRKSFKERIAAHLKAEFPETVGRMDAGELDSLIGYGGMKASFYGFATERDIRDYLELICRWGRDFDTDPGLPFADRILQEKMVFERQPRMKYLKNAQKKVTPEMIEALGVSEGSVK